MAVYVDRNWNFRVLERLSVTADNSLECLTIEINNEKNKSALISCVYRTPGCSIELFKDCMEALFTLRNHKTIFTCGGFNIDVLNPNTQKMTNDINNISHIITNDISNKTVSRILVIVCLCLQWTIQTT